MHDSTPGAPPPQDGEVVTDEGTVGGPPAELDAFVGRSAELGALAGALGPEELPAVTLPSGTIAFRR
ncbi:hypothetical protein ABT317_20130, partial [Streptomyces carpinensis]